MKIYIVQTKIKTKTKWKSPGDCHALYCRYSCLRNQLILELNPDLVLINITHGILLLTGSIGEYITLSLILLESSNVRK